MNIEILGGECAAAGLYSIDGSAVYLVKAGDALNVLVAPVADEVIQKIFERRDKTR